VDKLGKYEIVDRIGVGGFGVVYKGYDPFIKRHVAIKTCSAGDQETRDRFLREAEIAGNLQHRHIVTVFEFGFQDETPYLVQEFLTGEDLDHKIKRRDAVPIADKLAWLTEIARGLEFAHQRGVVHRDIKPANVRILHDNNAKILDFGIAKLAQQQSTLTQAGVTLGTASYLAPEQIRGEPVDSRTDVFAFGVLAYELLTYERPFRAQEISALFYKLLNEDAVAISSRTAGVPPELERVVLRCLAKDPAKRWSPTGELVRALERLERRPAYGLHPAAAPEDVDRTATMIAEGQTAAYPATQATVARPAAPPPPVPSAPALDDLELHPPSSGAISESRALASSGGGGNGHLAKLLWVGAGAAAAVAVTLLLVQDRAQRPAEEPAPLVAASAPRAESAAPVVETRPAKPAVATPEVEAQPRLEPEPEPPPPPKPEPPKPARLVIGPAWNPGMMVRIGSRRYRLDQEHTIEQPAGDATLEFSIATPAFVFERDLRVRLKPGAVERVSIPIEKPGRLTVQPHLNTRGGIVRIDGTMAGPTPLRGRWLAPGEHFVEVFAAGDALEPGFARSIPIASDAETVVTFDLDGRVEATVRDRPLPPG
jgi:serine/threonine-protein kinase